MTESVANSIITRHLSGSLKTLSPMKLQKLLFIGQCWHLNLYNDFLVEDGFAMWKYGPVLPSIYHKTQQYEKANINHIIYQYFNGHISSYEVPQSDTQTQKFLNKIIEVYGHLEGNQLADIILKNTDCPPESHPFERKHIESFVINVQKSILEKSCVNPKSQKTELKRL